MSEFIYVLTVIYFIFVVNEVEGDNITAFCRRVFAIDLSPIQKAYASLRERFLESINIKPPRFA